MHRLRDEADKRPRSSRNGEIRSQLTELFDFIIDRQF